MQLHINPHTETPLYRQIEQQIAAAIAERSLRPGELLQPEGELAVRLAVSPAAVRKAYDRLASEGLCDGSAEAGYRVASPALGSADEDRAGLTLSLQKRELLATELAAARAIQKRLLPPTDLEGLSWSLTARSFAAGALAGDFYDVFELAHGRLGLAVADVSGKGLAAGLIMAVVKSTLPYVVGQDHADAALMRLNRRLCSVLERRQFVALTLACFDPQDGTLELANAGLPDPYLLRTDDSIEPLAVPDYRFPIGIRPEATYSVVERTLTPGDRLLLFTDGLPEAIDRAGEPIGYRGLTRLLESCLEDQQDGSLLDGLLERARRRVGSMLADDWTVLLLEYRGT